MSLAQLDRSNPDVVNSMRSFRNAFIAVIMAGAPSLFNNQPAPGTPGGMALLLRKMKDKVTGTVSDLDTSDPINSDSRRRALAAELLESMVMVYADARELQTAGIDMGVNILLPAPAGTVDDGTGNTLVAAQQATGAAVANAVTAAVNNGAFAAGMSGALGSLASALGLPPGSLSATVDTSSFVLTTNNPRAPGGGSGPSSSGLSTGAIAGIAVGGTVVVAGAAVAIAAKKGFFKRKEAVAPPPAPASPVPVTRRQRLPPSLAPPLPLRLMPAVAPAVALLLLHLMLPHKPCACEERARRSTVATPGIPPRVVVCCVCLIVPVCGLCMCVCVYHASGAVRHLFPHH